MSNIKFFCKKEGSDLPQFDVGNLTYPADWATRTEGKLTPASKEEEAEAPKGYGIECGDELIPLFAENGRLYFARGDNKYYFSPDETKYIYLDDNNVQTFETELELDSVIKDQSTTGYYYNWESPFRFHVGSGAAWASDTSNWQLPDIAPEGYPKNSSSGNKMKTTAPVFFADAEMFFPIVTNNGHDIAWFSKIPLFASFDLFYLNGSTEEDFQGFENHKGNVEALNMGAGLGISMHRLLYHSFGIEPVSLPGGMMFDIYAKTDLIGARWYDLTYNVPGEAPAANTGSWDFSHIANTPNVQAGADLLITDWLGLRAGYQWMRFNDLDGAHDGLNVHSFLVAASFHIPSTGEYDAGTAETPPEEMNWAAEPELAPTLELMIITPKKVDLDKLQPIDVTAQVEFVPNKATMKPGQEDKITAMLDDAEKKIKDRFGGDIANIPEGYTAYMVVEGHASSEGGTMTGQAQLTKNRAQTVAGAINRAVETRRLDPASVFSKVTIDTKATSPVGRSEEEPILVNGAKLAKGTFGGYENDKANSKKDGTYKLCQSSTDPSMKVETQCAGNGGTVVDEDKNASRRVEVKFNLLPPGAEVKKGAVSVAGRDQAEADRLVTGGKAKLAKWFNKPTGVKKMYYNAEENAIYFVLDESFLTKSMADEAKADKFRNDLYAAVGTSNLSGDCKINVVLFKSTPATRDEEARLERAFYQYATGIKNPFGDAVFNFMIVEEKYDKNTAAGKATKASDNEKAVKLAQYVVENRTSADGFTAVHIPVADPKALTPAEAAKIRDIAAYMSGGSLTLYVVSKGQMNEGEATGIAMVVRSAFAGLKAMFFTSEDGIGNYVILVSGDKEVDLSSDEGKGLLKAIFDRLRNAANEAPGAKVEMNEVGVKIPK